MAKLLQAIDEHAFISYHKWIELDDWGQPKNLIKDGMSKPPTIKIQWSTPSGQEMSCNITPNRGLFGPEYALAFTIPDFEKKLLVQWTRITRKIPTT